jgi:hypothetical protein
MFILYSIFPCAYLFYLPTRRVDSLPSQEKNVSRIHYRLIANWIPKALVFFINFFKSHVY